jgi:hypothetical protein
MIGLQSNKVIKQKERGWHMSALTYTIDNLLVGKHYRSRQRHDEGTILHAEKRDSIWYGENLDAYAIEVRSTRGIKNFWATVAVRVGE